MNIRKYVSMITATAIVSLISTSIFAAPIPSQSGLTKESISNVCAAPNDINFLEAENLIKNVSKKYSKQVDGQIFDTIEVTNANDIETLARIHGFKNVEKISKIELVKVTPVEVTNPIKQVPKSQSKIVIQGKNYFIWNPVNEGSGWYSKTEDLKFDLYWDGPDTAEIEETTKESASYSCSVSVPVKSISACVGFNIISEYEVKYKSTTPVPSDKILNVKGYTTHQKKTFEVWESPDLGLPKYVETGSAYKPNGAYFAKAWSTK